MELNRLRACHMERPMGIAPEEVTLSYAIEGAEGAWQTAARILLSLDETEAAPLYDTGWVPCAHDERTGRVTEGIDNLAWRVPAPLPPRARVYWKAWARTDAGEEASSEWAWFETAKAAGEPWQAAWITSPLGRDVHPVFHTTFNVRGPLRAARMYCLGLGVYEALLDGEKLGDEVLLPGLHTYNHGLHYQTFALDAHEGANELCFLMGEGWYMGRYGLTASAPRYGDAYALIAEIHLLYQDGTEEILGTDEGWQVCPGPVLADSIYDGETFDARIPLHGACRPALRMDQPPQAPLMARLSPPIRVQERLKPTLCSAEKGILDFGQNMAGWVSFRCRAKAGARIRLTFGEILRDGELYRQNLRTAKAEFVYIANGGETVVRPHFTYYGFRYMRVEGWDGPLDPADFEGCVIHSQLERTGWLETSHEGLNRLFANQWWSQKCNFLDVPTDCPQRDERMGWTGDIQLFSQTALFNADCYAFLRKFLRDLWNDQQELNGCVPCVTPMAGYRVRGVAAWGDAAAIVPWQMYLMTGDSSILAAQLDSMTAWVDYIRRETERDQTGDLWTKTPQLGDWLALDGNSVYGGTDRGLIATAYYYRSASITARSAAIVGRPDIAKRYGELADRIREAFRREYVTPTGRLAVSTQTAYALALEWELLPEGARERARAELRRLVVEAGSRLNTGFVGTMALMDALAEGGSLELAYTLLLRREYPGWLYEIDQGATTIWERWNSIEPDGSMNRDGMNSLNHYAYGSVASWMYRVMGGLSPMPEAPGWRGIRIAPRPDRRIRRCAASVRTHGGPCACRWEWEGDTLHVNVTVPFGSVAYLTLPGRTETLRLTHGDYAYSVAVPKPAAPGLEQPWKDALAGKETRAVLEKHFPRALRGVAFQYEMYTLEQLTQSPFAELTAEQVRALEQALREAQDRRNP